jgi:4-carboxymuconolactone decarboxylase
MERQVVSLTGSGDAGVPRIPPRAREDWDDDVFDALSVLRKPGATSAPEVGHRPPSRPVSNLLGIFCQHPALAKGWMLFNNHLFRSTLSDRVRELVTVRTAWLRHGEYEWAQHVKMARAAGMSEEEIAAISEGPGSKVWAPLDAALLTAVDELCASRYISDAVWQQLSEHLDRKQLMDLVFTIGAYDVLAMAFHNFGLELDPNLEGFPAGRAE